jgi:hypothetical protein
MAIRARTAKSRPSAALTSVSTANRQDIDNHMVMRLPRDAGIQGLKKP